MESSYEFNKFVEKQRYEIVNDSLPLSGLRVTELSTVIAAPFAATLLADYGAEVIKVENPINPDALRNFGAIAENKLHPFWSVVGRNKLPITLNLQKSKGKEIFLDLICKSDVLIENMRPGALEKIGLDKSFLLKQNPGLVIGSVSGYGLSGPYSKRPGFGTLAEGFSGFTFLNAQPGGVPTNAPLALADFVTGAHLAFAILIALRNQVRGQRGGQVIDISLYEPLFGMLGPDFLNYFMTGQIPMPKGNELSYVAPRNNYRTKDGKWVSLSCAAQKPFERLMDCIGKPEFKKDYRFVSNEQRIKPENRKVLNEEIGKWISEHDMNKVLSICEKMSITIGPIASMKDIAKDKHYIERKSFIEITDPETSCLLKIPNLAFKMVETPGKIRFPGLPIGAANSVIFKKLLGYTEEKVLQLQDEGVF